MLCDTVLHNIVLYCIVMYRIAWCGCCIVNDEEQKGISLSDRDDDKPT